MKRKAKPLLVIIILILVVILSLLIYNIFFKKEAVQSIKVISTIDDYGYELKDNKDARYKGLFKELEKILQTKEVNYDEYAKKISEMFIYDFYSLSNKAAKNDVGGVDFIYPDALSNFLVNAENTYYKYVESNIYGNRKQNLPLVNEINFGELERIEFAVGDNNVDDAYQLEVTWNYDGEGFSDYQNSATLIITKLDKKLYIVELNK